jgi:hypothetical protein
MTRIEEIESRIRELNHDELSVLRRWFLEFDAETWDLQLEVDMRDGKLDSLADQALRDHKDGRSTDL